MPKKLLLASALGTLGAGGGMSLAAEDQAPPPIEREIFVLPLEQIIVPIVDAGQLDGSLKLSIALQAKDAAERDALGQRTPELRAATVAALTDFTRLYATSFTAVNAELLRSDLKAALRRQYPAVADVLVLQVSAEAA